MVIPFKKYQGTGNDFVLIDDRSGKWNEILKKEHIRLICDRRFGVGADGVMLLGSSEKLDFSMVYFNSDGNKSTMCGNGGRCIVHFAHSLNLFSDSVSFEFDDKEYLAEFDRVESLVSLKMQDVLSIETINEKIYYLDTGSPHYVQFVNKRYARSEVVSKGRSIRNSSRFKQIGTNVNFCLVEMKSLRVDTYERGVEDFTFSCGTGVVASSLAYCLESNKSEGYHEQSVTTIGGNLIVKYNYRNNQFSQIYLQGPAECVFKGVIELLF